jgi:hypothetical protein
MLNIKNAQYENKNNVVLFIVGLIRNTRVECLTELKKIYLKVNGARNFFWA